MLAIKIGFLIILSIILSIKSQDYKILEISHNETFTVDDPNRTDFLSNERFENYRIISHYTYIILKYYTILIIVLGTIFNIINFICFYRMKKRNSQNIYLSALSIADLYNLQIVNHFITNY